jgi:hypothetical protein
MGFFLLQQTQQDHQKQGHLIIQLLILLNGKNFIFSDLGLERIFWIGKDLVVWI